MVTKSPWIGLLSPQNIVFAPLLILFRLLVLLPFRVQMKVGCFLGFLLYYGDRKGKQTAMTNLTLCFPEYSEFERKQWLRKSYRALGLSIIETALAWFAPKEKLPPLTIIGLEYWQEAQKNNQGVLFLSAHLSALEIVGRLVTESIPLSVVYREQKLKILDAFARFYRAKIYRSTIERSQLKQLIQTLKSGGSVWYTPDVDAGLKNSVFAPFFKVPCATITTTSRLVTLGNAVCLTIFFYRKEDLSGYELWIAPAEQFPCDSELEDATYVNQLIEKAVCKAKDQYLWQYKRFKTRPPGETRLYGEKKRHD